MPEERFISEQWLAEQCTIICAKSAGVRSRRRIELIRSEINKLDISGPLKISLETLILTTEVAVVESTERWEKPAAFIFGCIFIVAMLVLAIEFPRPTPFQYFVFRVVLSLAAAGVGGILSGFLTVVFGDDKKPWLRAGGALALFVVIYMMNPARLVVQ